MQTRSSNQKYKHKPKPPAQTINQNHQLKPQAKTTTSNHQPKPQPQTTSPNHQPKPPAQTTSPNHKPKPKPQTTSPNQNLKPEVQNSKVGRTPGRQRTPGPFAECENIAAVIPLLPCDRIPPTASARLLDAATYLPDLAPPRQSTAKSAFPRRLADLRPSLRGLGPPVRQRMHWSGLSPPTGAG